MFVTFSVAGISLTAQEGRHHGDNCEWDPETFEVVCEDPPPPPPPPTDTPTDTPTPTNTPTPTESPTPTRTPTPTPTATNTPTPTPTLTPVPQPIRPRGWVRAGSSSIDVDESTLIQAGWTPASLDTTWHIGNTRVLWRSSQCSNTAGRSPPEDDPNNEGSGSLRVYGCQGGSSVVQLKVRNTGQVLGVVTITVNCVTNCGGDPPPGGGNPPPPQPTGWIEASPSKIVVGQTTTITAGWSNLDQDPNIVPISTSLAPSCGGATGKSIIGPQQTQVMTGCSAGTIAVTLRNAANNKILASVTVKVYPKPLITSHSRIGYKYFKIGWLAKSDFTTFHVEWRHHGTTVPFVRLPGQASETSRARAEINAQSTGASIRALPYSSRDAEMQIVAVTTSGLEATSRPYRVPRGEQPHALGHLPDHRMNYSMSGLATSGDLLAGWIRAVAPSVARIWAAAVPGVEACQNDCPGDSGNKDGETVTLQIDGCRSVDRACYKGDTKKSVNWTIDGPGFMALNRQPRSPGLISIWTDVQAQDGEKVYPNGDPTVPDSLQHTYAWVKATVVHEFGHMFGLAHPVDPSTYTGVMDGYDILGKKTATLRTDDLNAIRAIYKTHIRNEGW